MTDDAVRPILSDQINVLFVRLNAKPSPAALFKNQSVAESPAVNAPDLDKKPSALLSKILSSKKSSPCWP
jgi:hypothetical protein